MVIRNNKKTQLRKTGLTKAACFYNAAAGYFNSGMTEKTLDPAQKASLHKARQHQALEL